MNDLPQAFYSGWKLKEIDSLIVHEGEVTGYQLMCRAGQAAFNLLQECWPHAKSIAVFCGLGNNGGDGFVLAKIAKAQGLTVNVYEIERGDEKRLPLEAGQARKDWLAVGEIIPFQQHNITEEVVVDALLGIGARAPLSQALQEAILAINRSQKPVLALDIPSGLDANTGSLLGVCVKATHTISFVGMKIGTVLDGGIEQVGELHFDSLGVSCERYSHLKPEVMGLDYAELILALSKRHLTTHKGEQGHVGIVGGGQSGYSGAPCLAGEAALRAGAGLVSLVVAPESLSLLARGPQELMCYGPSSYRDVQALFDKFTVIVLGPGLSTTKWGKGFFKSTLKRQVPMVVDADGLNWLSQFPQKRDNWILTPHPGEAARLLKTTVAKVQANRLESVKTLQKQYGGTVVLKGAGTLIASETEEVFIQAGGYPVLATGGTGDVLAGLIGALLAQGQSLSSAAKLGVSIHASAAQAESLMGTRGMLASDLFLHIRNFLNPGEKEI